MFPKQLLILWSASVVVGCAGEGAPRRFFSMGTGGTGGIYYPLGGALASRLSLADSTRQYTAEVTGGSVENVNRVSSGEMDFGMSLALTIHRAYHGSPDFPDRKENLRLLSPLYPNVLHVLGGRRANLAHVGDLRGKRVSVGPPGSGTEQSARAVLTAHGISYDDVHEQFLSFREASDALKDGAIDAAFVSAGYPAAAVLEATTTRAAVLIPFEESARQQLLRNFAYFSDGVIPSGAYPGQTDSIPTLVTLNWLVGTVATDSAVVDLVLTTLERDRARLEQVHRVAAQIDLSVMGGRTPIPLHPAALSWWERRIAQP